MVDRTWTADDVADHFEEAFRTLRKLPPVKVQGYLSAWPQCKCWIKIPQKCWRKIPHLTGLGISRSGDLRLRSWVAGRAVSGAAAV